MKCKQCGTTEATYWHGFLCGTCKNNYETFRRRSRGQGPIDESKSWRHQKGRAAEKLVAQHYEREGWKVQLSNGWGPDLTICNGSRTWTVEVKTVTQVRRKGRHYWYVPPPMPNRRGDDFIAIVLPDGSILIEPMCEHLAKCNRSFTRYVTSLVNQHAI